MFSSTQTNLNRPWHSYLYKFPRWFDFQSNYELLLGPFPEISQTSSPITSTYTEVPINWLGSSFTPTKSDTVTSFLGGLLSTSSKFDSYLETIFSKVSWGYDLSETRVLWITPYGSYPTVVSVQTGSATYTELTRAGSADELLFTHEAKYYWDGEKILIGGIGYSLFNATASGDYTFVSSTLVDEDDILFAVNSNQPAPIAVHPKSRVGSVTVPYKYATYIIGKVAGSDYQLETFNVNIDGGIFEAVKTNLNTSLEEWATIHSFPVLTRYSDHTRAKTVTNHSWNMGQDNVSVCIKLADYFGLSTSQTATAGVVAPIEDGARVKVQYFNPVVLDLKVLSASGNTHTYFNPHPTSLNELIDNGNRTDQIVSGQVFTAKDIETPTILSAINFFSQTGTSVTITDEVSNPFSEHDTWQVVSTSDVDLVVVSEYFDKGFNWTWSNSIEQREVSSEGAFV